MILRCIALKFVKMLQLCLIINEEKCNVEVRLLFNVDLQDLKQYFTMMNFTR